MEDKTNRNVGKKTDEGLHHACIDYYISHEIAVFGLNERQLR